MADTSAPTNLDIAEQVARVLRSNEETQKFVAEQHKLIAEQTKLQAEQTKLQAEAAKLERDRALAPWQIVAATAAASTALVGAGIALAKVFLP